MTAALHERIERRRSALRDRIATAAPVLGVAQIDDEPTSSLLQRMAATVRERGRDDELWLLYIAVSGVFPEMDELIELRRRLSLAEPGAELAALLEATMEGAAKGPESGYRMRLVQHGVVADVHFSATTEHNTGIQRVVRRTMPEWERAGRGVELVVWTDSLVAMRPLSERERDRVLSWTDRRFAPGTRDEQKIDEIIVPWRSQVFVPEVPIHPLTAPLAALARFSGNRVSMIGHDAIPLVSAHTLVPIEAERYARFLTMVRYADRIVGVSESAAREFAGFAKMVPAQGLRGPSVRAVPLATEVPHLGSATPAPGADPLVLCVGSHEPRKNQEAVLQAARLLHRDGARFRLVFVGAGSTLDLRRFDARLSALRKTGLQVSSARGLSDAGLWELFAEARFSVFPSLHEGFGLPAVESLALGTPVLTSDFGSLAEVAAGGGCVTVDPRDDEAIAAAMRSMLEDDELIARLLREIAARPDRTWRQYADELWEAAELGGEVA